jgi:membrane associated rhomboid family serine protease
LAIARDRRAPIGRNVKSRRLSTLESDFRLRYHPLITSFVGEPTVGIYDRDYYRDDPPSSNWGIDGLMPGVKYLIVANVIVFLLQIFVVHEERSVPLEILRKWDANIDRLLADKEAGRPIAEDELAQRIDKWNQEPGLDVIRRQQVYPVTDWLQLDTDKVIKKGQVWRLVTNAFCHDSGGLWHILFNMLGLFWFGCTLESMYGTREFLLFYFTAILAASLAFMGLELITGLRSPMIGASGGIMAVLMLYAYHFPTAEVLLFWFIPIQIRFLVIIYALWDIHPVLLELAGKRVFTGVAHAAHLGGLAFGFLYAKCQWHLSTLVDHLLPMSRKSRSPRRRANLRIAPETRPEPIDDDPEEVDRILRKISKSGQASLSDEELETLHKASKRLNNRPANEDRYPWE